MPVLDHGLREPRGLSNTPCQKSYDGRFGRMFQSLAKQPAHDPENPEHRCELRTLAEQMRDEAGPGGDNARVPAGYVYLGQFIDDGCAFLLVNRARPDQPSSPDLPRNAHGRALIGNPRNDENGIVSQLHVAFLSLHNQRMDDLEDEIADSQERFEQAQQDAQWHYQWLVVHDFLRRTVGDGLHDRLLVTVEDADGTVRDAVRLRYYRHKANPYLPVEFSAAAYRFGHSQVRDRYFINRNFDRRLFDPSGNDFRGFQPLRPGWHASWPFFFPLDGEAPQLSRSIDSNLTPALTRLQGQTGDNANLPPRNLLRGAALGLPAGQAVAREMEWNRCRRRTWREHRAAVRHCGSTC